MKKLTKKQRNRIYKEALKIQCNRPSYICCIIDEIMGAEHDIDDFKEVVLFRRHKDVAMTWVLGVLPYWTDEGIELRKTVLEFCIAMTE